MPIYEYQCESCHRLTETLLKVGEKGPKKCPHCGGKLTRVISRTSFQLKGGGWYKDLYASSKPESGGNGDSATSGASSETKSSATAETKTETKTETKSGPEKPSKTESPKPAAAPAKTGKSATKKAG